MVTSLRLLSYYCTQHTSSEKYSKPMPTGRNAIPMMKKVGRTVPAVRIGCQAGNLCCLNALSEKNTCETKRKTELDERIYLNA